MGLQKQANAFAEIGEAIKEALENERLRAAISGEENFRDKLAKAIGAAINIEIAAPYGAAAAAAVELGGIWEPGPFSEILAAGTGMAVFDAISTLAEPFTDDAGEVLADGLVSMIFNAQSWGELALIFGKSVISNTGLTSAPVVDANGLFAVLEASVPGLGSSVLARLDRTMFAGWAGDVEVHYSYDPKLSDEWNRAYLEHYNRVLDNIEYRGQYGYYDPNSIDNDLGDFWTNERLKEFNDSSLHQLNGNDAARRGAGTGSANITGASPGAGPDDVGATPDTPGKKAGGEHKKGQSTRSPQEVRGLPVVLDLGGNGLAITELSSSNVFFDMAGDGYGHRTAWAGVGNGVLAIDADGDGAITERKEIVFGDWDPSAEDDMAALRSVFDTNDNGKLDSGDAEFANFRVVVTNADGTTTVRTLAELGIASIDLITDATQYTLADGSSIDGMATYTRTDNSTGKAAAVTLATESRGYAVENGVVTNGDGSTTVTNVGRDASGAIANVTVTTTSADGSLQTNSFDYDGDGVADRVQTILEVTNGDGSRTETITNRNGGNVLLDRTETIVIAGGGASIDIVKSCRGVERWMKSKRGSRGFRCSPGWRPAVARSSAWAGSPTATTG